MAGDRIGFSPGRPASPIVRAVFSRDRPPIEFSVGLHRVMDTKDLMSLDPLQKRLSDVSAQVQHENELLNHRLTWMWTLQGLLFAAYGFLSRESIEKFTATTVCVVGIVSCISIGYSLLVGVKVLDIINPVANDLRKDIDTRLDRVPTGISGKPSFWAFLFPWIILPWFMAGTWLVLLVYTLAFRT